MIWLRSTAIISSSRHCAHSDKNLSHPWGHHEPTQTIYIDVKWCAWDMIDEMNGIVVNRTYRQTCAAGNSNQPIVHSALSDQYGNGPSFVALHFRLRHMSEHREHCTVKVWFWARQMERLIVREYIYSVLATRAECTCWLICSVLCVCFAHTPNQYRSTVESSIQWAPILSSENIFFLLSIAPTNMFITSICHGNNDHKLCACLTQRSACIFGHFRCFPHSPLSVVDQHTALRPQRTLLPDYEDSGWARAVNARWHRTKPCAMRILILLHDAFQHALFVTTKKHRWRWTPYSKRLPQCQSHWQSRERPSLSEYIDHKIHGQRMEQPK